MSPGLEASHSRFLADSAGNQQEGNFQANLTIETQSFQSAETGHVVIRKDQITVATEQRLFEGLLLVDPAHFGPQALAFEQELQKFRIVNIVFNQQDAHRRLRHSGAPAKREG